MKVTAHFKDPDVLSDAIDEAVKEWAKTLGPMDEDEREAVMDARAKKVREAIVRKFVEWGEYLVVEFDTDAGTATVQPVKR